MNPFYLLAHIFGFLFSAEYRQKHGPGCCGCLVAVVIVMMISSVIVTIYHGSGSSDNHNRSTACEATVVTGPPRLRYSNDGNANGTVDLMVIVMADGSIQPSISHSSGNDTLDQAAINEVTKWIFNPAIAANGRHVKSTMKVYVSFDGVVKGGKVSDDSN